MARTSEQGRDPPRRVGGASAAAAARLVARMARLAPAAALLAALPAQGDPAAAPRELRRRALTVDDRGSSELPEIHVAGGATTLIAFPVALREGGALLADPQGLFYPLSQADRTVVVAPRADLSAPAALHVSLSDGTVLSFKLASVRRESDAQVDVHLAPETRAAPETAPALRSALEAARGELEECRAGAAGSGVASIAALVAAHARDESRPFERHPLRGSDRQHGLLVEGEWVYRMLGTTLLVFRVENRDPLRPWALDGASVRLAGGGEVTDVLAVSASAEAPSLAPEAAERVVVGFRSPPQGPGQRLTVTLRERDGARHVVLEGLAP